MFYTLTQKVYTFVRRLYIDKSVFLRYNVTDYRYLLKAGLYMKWFAKLEHRLGKYAIKNLMMYLMVLYVIGTLIFLGGYSDVYYTYLSLNPEAILKRGQVWRLVTFLMMPAGGSNIFFMLLSLYVYWNLGTVVERYWGAFKFNVYMFSGIIGTILATFIVYFIYGSAVISYLLAAISAFCPFSLCSALVQPPFVAE